MKKTTIKRIVDDLVKSVETKYEKKCEIMTLSLATQITGKGELFVHAETIVNLDDDENSYSVSKDYDL